MVVLAITWLYWFKLGHFFPPMSATRKERAVERVQTDFQHFIALIERVRHPTLTSLSTLQKRTLLWCTMWNQSGTVFELVVVVVTFLGIANKCKLPHFGRVSSVAANPFDVSEHLGPWGRRNGYVMLCLNSWPIQLYNPI